ncbi:MAG: alpha-mannosidase [Clostridia bacterium]|nr:alpha-mannosidase [Clostridia bacterium]
MLTVRGFEQTRRKLERFCETLYQRLFTPVGQAQNLRIYETTRPLHEIPDDRLFSGVNGREKWGGEGVYGWFKGEFVVPEELDGKALYLYPRMDAYEGTLWVNGKIHSNFAAKFVEGSHGNHYCNRITASAKAGETFSFALENYAFHDMPGTQPLFYETFSTYLYKMGGMDICVRDDEIMEFLFDLRTLLSLERALDDASFRKAEVQNAMYEAHLRLFYDPATCTRAQFLGGINAASAVVKGSLSKMNGEGAPFVGLIGHSHMDTAWLWPITETEKKCARTYANQLNLMEEYPEYKFIQSSAYHAEMIRRNNPDLFKRIQKAVKEGKYEPNGGVWVECDCNLTGGEYMIRQFLWGQRFTRKYFNYTSDCFWLPDTFGYSYAIPQIMKKCGVDYFLTTKMAWNDTNRFPYTSFYWQGIDGTRVLTHLNRTHIGPTPETVWEVTSGSDAIAEKRVSDMRLLSYGRGDGGGGPEFEMLEMARRLKDLSGVPRCDYTTVSEFMHELEKYIYDPSVYAGEMYLELHRGTLTNQSEIKRNNRDCEIALHNLELATVLDAVKNKKCADGSEIAPLMNDLLVRQFHDILPGTCIHTVHEEAKRVVGNAISKAREMTEALGKKANKNEIALTNPLSFKRKDTLHIETGLSGVKNFASQKYTDLFGKSCLAISGAEIPAFASITLKEGAGEGASVFVMEGNTLKTPFAEITFDENGAISSMKDALNGRELVNGLPFNTFLMAEDLPAAWDNWDIDADEEEKFAPAGKLLSREVVSDGPVELRIRSKYQLSEKSFIEQDMVFDANSPLITFETIIDWQEEHRFLKTAFDTSLHADGVRSEIQFGHIRRSNHRSTDVEKARFEICNHKFSDLSENAYGIALLNDSKYGLSVNEGSMRLSLHKGGMLPDSAGDKGRHFTRYAILPHAEGFSAKSVVQPAYAFNYLPIAGKRMENPLVSVDKDNIIIEAVKPLEDAENAYILRLYDAAGDYTKTNLSFGHAVKRICQCNMLEEEIADVEKNQLTFKPFEIKTVKVEY